MGSTSAGHRQRLRLAQLADVPILTDLIRLSATELSNGYYTPAQAAGLVRYVFGVDSQLIHDDSYYVIERNDGIVACGGWSRRRTLFGGDQLKGTSDPLLDPATDAARIRAFFVHPRAVRQGLGGQLLRYCESQAEAAGFRRLELMATLPGVPLYQAMGYTPIEDVSLTLPDGQDIGLLRMGKSFQ